MRIPRIYVAQPLDPGAVIDLDARAARHVSTVLRLARGAMLTLFNGAGGEHSAIVQAVGRRSARVTVGPHVARSAESPLHVTLAQGIARGERMDLCVQKAVELGATQIVPLDTERSGVRLDAERAQKRRRHWQRIAIAACEQCRRDRVPEVEHVISLTTWLEQASDAPRLVLDPQARQTLADIQRPEQSISVLVGPEGGLSEPKIAAAAAHGCTRIRLGPRVLRTETAGITALAALQTLWGDLQH